jgi:lipopolysaccharide export LptBFGC system permease protein LptF
MGRTLFWYIFKDLLRIFVMANGALAGIMSFGGLLRPLTHQGLDAGQVGKLLGYFNLAMLTYSLPIAALFATTVVYGRLSADNELTACRAGGLSYLAVTLPAFVLGILVAILSLVFLCFVVPIYTLKAEQTLYSNMAKLIAGSIQRTHQISLGPGVAIFAQEAYIPPESGKHGQQIVVLKGPTIETIVRPIKEDRTYRIPKDFYTASEAVIYIEQRERGEQRGTGRVFMTVRLIDGMKFPREFESGVEAGVAYTEYGPMEVDSPIREDTKFMDVWRLKRLYHDPSQGAKVKQILGDLVWRDQQAYVADQIAGDLNNLGQATFRLSDGEVDVLKRDRNSPLAQSRGGGVVIPPAPPVAQVSAWVAGQVSADAMAGATGLPSLLMTPMGQASDSHPITFERQSGSGTSTITKAREARIQIRPTGDADTIRVSIELLDVVRRIGTDEFTRGSEPPESLDIPLSAAARKIASRDVGFYARVDREDSDRRRIGREVVVLSNQILAESNSRVSFAISCLVLVMVGSALGMMFRSGNFLSAFAISFIPALMTITLIVAGQRVSGNLPDDLRADIVHYINSPLKLGLCLIWTGNCVNFVLAVILLGRLQRK